MKKRVAKEKSFMEWNGSSRKRLGGIWKTVVFEIRRKINQSINDGICYIAFILIAYFMVWPFQQSSSGEQRVIVVSVPFISTDSC
jgi:hypothetical protein